MRTIAKLIVNLILGAVILLIVMSVSGRTERSMELKDNLSSAVEETVEMLTANPKYTLENTDVFLADLAASVADSITSDSNIKVDVENIDMEKNLLSIKVTAEFIHPNGKTGTVSCEKTAIVNKVEEAEQIPYTVTFFVDREAMLAGKKYKSYKVLDGDLVPAPAIPISGTGTFLGWKDTNQYLSDFSQPVTQDLVYYGEWN